MNIITEDKAKSVLLTNIRLGYLFQADDTVYLKTNHVRHTNSNAIINEDTTTSMSLDDEVLVVAIGTGKTFYFKLDKFVIKVVQESPIRIRVDG